MDERRVVGRKRARPVASPVEKRLREDVLRLIRHTKAPFVAQRQRVERTYDAAWRSFCGAMSAENGGSGTELPAALRALALVAREVSELVRDLLVTKIASSVVVSRGNARQQRLLMLWCWLGHTHIGRLWDMGDVLLAAASAAPSIGDADDSSVTVWVRGAIGSLIQRPLEEQLAHQLFGSGQSVSIASSILQYLVRMAFPAASSTSDPAGMGGAVREDDRFQRGDTMSIARAALQSICASTHEAPTPFVQVCRAVASSLTHHASDAAVVTTLRVFLRTEIKAFLVAIVSSASLAQSTYDAVQDILSMLQGCVSAADVVQLFRQVWTELDNASVTHHDPIESLAPFIASCAQRDANFRSNALATAHDLANDAMTASDATLLRHSIELAAAVTAGKADEDGHIEDAGYADWFRDHFAALDAAASVSSDTHRQSLSGQPVVSGSTMRCLRAPPLPSASAGSTTSNHGHTPCGLVSTKRHLQFVCAFLLEFDRVDSSRMRAHHVFAHLSAMKTHHTLSGSAVGGLLADFCSQTRTRFGQLESQEQETTARLRRRRLSSMSSVKTTPSVVATPTQSSLSTSQYASTTRGDVEELLELYGRDQNALAAKVNQLKLFEASKWKNEILPCCLDLEYWQATVVNPHCETEEGYQVMQQQRRKRLSEIVKLVQLVARHRAVGTKDYAAFLERVEAWFLSIEQPTRTPSRRFSKGSNDYNLTALTEAVENFADSCSQKSQGHPLREPRLRQSWDVVTGLFVTAFEGLINELPSEQPEQMQKIHTSTAERVASQVASGGLGIDHAIECYMALWIALLSNEATTEGTPEDRLQVMLAYCQLASQSVNCETCSPRLLSEQLAETSLYGCLLGVLASVPVCEALARSASLAFCAELVPNTTDPSADDLVHHLKQASAFLSGFTTGFLKNPVENAPQMLFQSMLTPQMRECLIWVGHHTSTWWNADYGPAPLDAGFDEDKFWPYVRRSIQWAHDQHGWFRLTFSSGVFTTKDQWQVFIAMELACCVTQVLRDGRSRVDLVDFITLQHEQMNTLMLTSTGGKAAGIQVTDVCIWIVQATLELASSTPPVSGHALNALVLLLKDVWSARVNEASGEPTSPSNVLGFLMEMSLQLAERIPQRQVPVLQYAVRCAKVLVEGRGSTPELVSVSPLVIRQFVDVIATSSNNVVLPFEWVSVVWCIVLKVQHADSVYAAATDVPPSIFSHWAYEFPRLCRLLTVRKNGRVSHATNATVLRSVQTCYEFFRTLNVKRLAPAPAMSIFGVSASQYVPTSAADETLELHVRALQWLVACELIQTPIVGVGDALSLSFDTSLAFHQTATRVLAALLEDVSIGRPDEVATEVAEICQTSWLASVASGGKREHPSHLQYELLLVHMVSELAARHGSVGRFLLRSSSELLNDSRRALFLLLVLITSKEIVQLDNMLKLNGSLWVNTFAEVACTLVDVHHHFSDDSRLSILSTLQHASSVNDHVTSVVSHLLSFAAANQIDLLDSAVIARIETFFPTLRELLANVPVLNLASAALADW